MKKTDAAEDSPKKEMKEIMKKSLISYIHQYKHIPAYGQEKNDYFFEENRKSEKNLEYLRECIDMGRKECYL